MRLSVLIVVLFLLNTGANMASGSQIGAGLGAAAGMYFGGPYGAMAGANIGSSFGGMFDEPGGEHPTGKPLAIYDQMRQQYEWQKEFAQSGVQWRVQDAKAAGLHPVFALGGGGAAYSGPTVAVEPSIGGSMSDMGQNLSRAAAAVSNYEQRAVTQLQKDLLSAQIRKTNAEALAITGGARNRDQVGPGFPLPDAPSSSVLGSDMAVVEADKSVSPDRTDLSVSAGDFSPALKRFSVKSADGQDTVMYLPHSNSMSESLESLSESPLLMHWIVKENMRRDPDFAYKMRHAWPGGESYYDIRDALATVMESTARWYDSRRRAAAASREIARQWWDTHRRSYGDSFHGAP